MSRILVLGPGPLRPGVGAGASQLAREIAAGLAERGHEIVVLDASPTSALLEPGLTASRYLEPLTPRSVRAVAETAAVDALVAEGMGLFAARGAREALEDLAWLGRSPAALVKESPGGGAAYPEPRGERVIDAVVASDGETSRVVAWFAADTSEGWAVCDATHALGKGDHAGLVRCVQDAHLPRGLVTVRLVDDAVLFSEALDTALVSWAAEAAGLVAGVVLARLLDGAAIEEAVAGARPRSERASRFSRAPSFGDGGGGAPLAIPRSLGGRLVASKAAAPVAPPSRGIVLVGPSAPRPGHGDEASAACRRATEIARGAGRDVLVVTERCDVGAGGVAPEELSGGAAGETWRGFGAAPGESAADATRGGDAIELHVILLASGGVAKLAGTFEHVERGVHPSDAAAVFPSLVVSETALRAAEESALAHACTLPSKGIVTVRFAVTPGDDGAPALLGVEEGVTTHVLSLEHVLGVDLVSIAARLALGEALDLEPLPVPRHVAVEEHVFPFAELGAADTKLGARPRATGTVLGIARTVGRAYAKALRAMGVDLRAPEDGERLRVLLAGAPSHSLLLADLARRLYALGFDLATTAEAAVWLDRRRVPHAVEAQPARAVAARRYHAVVAPGEGAELRRAALEAQVACFTTVELVEIAVRALEEGTTRPPTSLASWVSEG